MVELSILVWVLAAFFALVGWSRGWVKEIIALAGITLGLFAMSEFQILFNNIFDDLLPDQRFYLQTILFLLVVFFAYQTRALDNGGGRTERDETQSKALGSLVGFANGYLIGGTLWYFLLVHPNPQGNYALAPYVVQPPPGTASAAAAGGNLPLQVLTAGSNGDLLSLLVVVLFIVVLVLI